MVLHFSGIDSISDAETLTGLIVAIPRSERAQLGEDEVYISDMIGCTLIDVANGSTVTIGEIEDVDRAAGPVALLVIRGAAREILIPFAKAYLVESISKPGAWRWRCQKVWPTSMSRKAGTAIPQLPRLRAIETEWLFH